MRLEEKPATCTSVFKSGENTTSKAQFTGKWIELINKMEKDRKVTTGRHP